MVRHGQTNYNVYGIYQGQLDTPLNEVGVAQANALKKRFLKSEIHIDGIWSSDLQRARATVAPIAAELSLPIHLHAGLREIHVGDFTDKPHKLVESLYSNKLETFKANFPNSTYPNGENIVEARVRIHKTVCEIAEKNDGKTILAASHGGAIHSLIAEIYRRADLIAPNVSISNCSLLLFEYENDNITLRSIEDENGKKIAFDDIEYSWKGPTVL